MTQRSRNTLTHFAWLIAISILYGAILFIPLPPQLKRQGVFLADELLFLVLLVLVLLTFRYPSRGAGYIRLLLILIAFTLPLLRLWETAESTWNIVMGLLPWADAAEYYFDASRLLQGGSFSAFSGRRPLFASLLATILQLSHQNLQITLLVFTIINGLAVFLFMEEVYHEFGSISAVIVLFLSQVFYRPFVGTVLTEQLGYAVGMLALAVLLRAVKKHKAWLFLAGLMFLTYALLIRAGAFFVLPVLIVFAVMHFSENRHQSLKILLLAVAAVLIPVITNAWLGRTAASSDAVQFANFADTLYGQAKGGVRWTQAVVDHPELANMIEPQRSQLLYRLAFEEIKRNPLGLAKGSVKAWTDFLLPGPHSAFGFLTFGNKTIDLVLQVCAILIFLAGLWLLWKNRREPVTKLLLLLWLGIFLSIPFLPPIDAGIRPYAATVTVLFLSVCFVFSSSVIKSLENSKEENRIFPLSATSVLLVLLVITSLLGAPILKTTTRPAGAASASCEPNLTPVSFKLFPGSYIFLSSATDNQETHVPVVLLADVQKSFDDFAYGDFARIVRKIKRPALVAAATDLTTGRGVWIIAPSELGIYEDQALLACAEAVVSTYPVMFIQTVETP